MEMGNKFGRNAPSMGLEEELTKEQETWEEDDFIKFNDMCAVLWEIHEHFPTEWGISKTNEKIAQWKHLDYEGLNKAFGALPMWTSKYFKRMEKSASSSMPVSTTTTTTTTQKTGEDTKMEILTSAPPATPPTVLPVVPPAPVTAFPPAPETTVPLAPATAFPPAPVTAFPPPYAPQPLYPQLAPTVQPPVINPLMMKDIGVIKNVRKAIEKGVIKEELKCKKCRAVIEYPKKPSVYNPELCTQCGNEWMKEERKERKREEEHKKRKLLADKEAAEKRLIMFTSDHIPWETFDTEERQSMLDALLENPEYAKVYTETK